MRPERNRSGNPAHLRAQGLPDDGFNEAGAEPLRKSTKYDMVFHLASRLQ